MEFANNIACNELMVQDCIKHLRQHPEAAHTFFQALLEGGTVSFHGYVFTDHDTQRIYKAYRKTNKGRNYDGGRIY